MIIESLIVLLLGSVVSFVIMGVIFLGLIALHRFRPADTDDK